jgi:hypothetical protein
MRLINVNTLALKDFNETNTPPYAILSHTWVDGQEVSFQEMLDPNRATRKKSGYQKIVRCANEAKDHNLQWIWVDTCSIDKSSSAELSEAINSMYLYYRKADMCFAYLADVAMDSNALRSDHPSNFLGINMSESAGAEIKRQFAKSKWFTRGWTLQELIAPRSLAFYSSKWTFLCDKSTVADRIAEITGIPADVLRSGNTSTCSVAQRLSWAATRQTTRTEDIAYCLLGILDVNMPLLYGEGKKAFTRLQEEIIRNSTDQSILAWEFPADLEDPLSYVSGVLADSPERFARCGDITEAIDVEDEPQALAFAITNLGLNIYLPVRTYPFGIISASLACQRSVGTKDEVVHIYMRQLRKGIYARVPNRTEFDNGQKPEHQTLAITSRSFPSISEFLHFHEAYAMNLSSSDYNLKTVFMAPNFSRPRNFSLGTLTRGTFRFQRPVPRPDQDLVWVAIVVGDFHTAVILLGIRPSADGDVLWCQYTDPPMPGDLVGRIAHVETIINEPLAPLSYKAMNYEQLRKGIRYRIPTDYTACYFRALPGAAVAKEEKKVKIECRPEIVDHRLVLHIHIGCFW